MSAPHPFVKQCLIDVIKVATINLDSAKLNTNFAAIVIIIMKIEAPKGNP